MQPPSRKPVIAASITIAVFLIGAVYLFATKFLQSVHSDAAVTTLLASKMLSSGALVPRDFYWANGDVWLLGPHLFALIPVALVGVGPPALIAAVLCGFLAEIVVLTWSYRQLVEDLRVALFATAVTLIAWSRVHVLFVYLELSYGFVTTLYIALFVAYAKWVDREAADKVTRSSLFPGAVTLLVFVVTLQNPTRGAVFVLGPLLSALAWPFYGGVTLRARLRIAISALFASAASFGVYKLVFRRVLTFAVPSGHDAFELKNVDGVIANARMLASGLCSLAGGRGEWDVLTVPAILMIGGALVIVAREVIRGRTVSMTRFVGVAVLTQLSIALAPMLLGNLMVNPASARYLMPSISQLLALAVIISAAEIQRSTANTIAVGWTILTPAVAAFSAARLVGSYNLEAANGQWAHSSAHAKVADELSRRGLTHGFSSYWNANLITLLSRGKAKTCAVHFATPLVPNKWVTDTECFDQARLPERIFVVESRSDEQESSPAVRATLGAPTERFDVDGVFAVSVFARDAVRLNWLVLPLPEGSDIRFPLHLSVSHPALRTTDRVHVADAAVTATGEEGTLTFGPYLRLPKGHYRATWFGTGIPSEGTIAFDVGAEGGARNLVQTSHPAASLSSVNHGVLATLDFDLPRETAGVELRTYSSGGGLVRLEEVVLDH